MSCLIRPCLPTTTMKRSHPPKVAPALEAWARETIAQALEHHRQGDLARAEAMYREVLTRVENYPDALQLLGLIYKAANRMQEALQLLNAAIALNPHPVYYTNRAGVLLELKEHALAEQDAMVAIRSGQASADTYINLLSALRSQKKRRKLQQIGADAIRAHPDNASVWNNYGAGLLDLGESQAARDAFARAVDLAPEGLVWRETLAKILWSEGRTQEALVHSEAAFGLGSRSAQVLRPYGEHLHAQAPESAIEVLMRLMREGEAEALAEPLLQPAFVNMMFAVAGALQDRLRLDDAIAMLHRLAELRGDSKDVVNNLGVAYFKKSDYRTAIAHFTKALALEPDSVMMLRNLGVCHFMLIELEEALRYFKDAVAAAPDDCVSLLYLYGQKLSCVDWSDLEAVGQKLLRLSLEQEPEDLSASLAYLMLIEKAEDMKRIAALVGRSVFKDQPIYADLPPVRSRKEGRIRIGYFSYDFRTHPVSYLTEEIYGLHDRSRFEVHALSYGPDDGSAFRRNIERDVDVFIDFEHCTSREIVERVRALELDVLIDLTGNTQGTRSRILINRLAPVQCHWLGYVSSMGEGVYDYLFGDPFTTPPNLDEHYAECVARLPFTMQISSRWQKPSDRVFTRADFGIPEDAFVFANFGSFAKIHPKVFDAWMHILKNTPGSVLWLARTHRTPKVAFERLAAVVQRHGIAPKRVIFSEPLGREDHLHRYSVADLCLDTYPQGSGTTAIECLSMACPMVSMADAGETYAIRMPGSILTAAGMAELITGSVEDYQALAIALGHDRARTRALRERLQASKATLPLFDTPRAVRYLEQALLHMAERARAGLPPEDFSVAASL